jgi:hypothetical protein
LACCLLFVVSLESVLTAFFLFSQGDCCSVRLALASNKTFFESPTFGTPSSREVKMEPPAAVNNEKVMNLYRTIWRGGRSRHPLRKSRSQQQQVEEEANSSAYASSFGSEDPNLIQVYPAIGPPMPWRCFHPLRKSKSTGLVLSEQQEQSVKRAIGRIPQSANIEDNLPFVTALVDKHCPELKVCVKPITGATFLILAVICGHKELAAECLKLKANPNSTKFLSKTVDLNTDDPETFPEMRHGYSPLFLAIICQQLEIADMLVEAGASVDTCDRWGRTPLHAAGELKDAEAVAWLLQRKAPLQRYDRDACRPFDLLNTNPRYTQLSTSKDLEMICRIGNLPISKCTCCDCCHHRWFIERTRSSWLPSQYLKWMAAATVSRTQDVEELEEAPSQPSNAKSSASAEQLDDKNHHSEEQAPSPAVVVD